jgi:cytochrome c553
MNSFNPIRRSPLKPKARQHKESMPWRRPKIRLNGSEMLDLRQDAFARSGERCENSVTEDGTRCPVRINWMSFHLAHLVSRGRGGSDELANVLAACQRCHDADTHNRRKLRPHKDWIAKA